MGDRGKGQEVTVGDSGKGQKVTVGDSGKGQEVAGVTGERTGDRGKDRR